MLIIKKIVSALAVICVILAVTTGIVLAVTGRPSGERPEFVPPEFDRNAVSGVPTVPDDLGWYEVYKAGMSFKAMVCGEIRIRNGAAKVYFTNPKENTLWLKLRVTTEKGDILAETGLIKPGEYLPEITFDSLPDDGEKIILRLMSYQPDTYYSGGSVTLTTVAQIKGE